MQLLHGNVFKVFSVLKFLGVRVRNVKFATYLKFATFPCIT